MEGRSMPQSVVFITDKSVSMDQLKSKFEPHFQQCFESPSRVVLKSGEHYVAINVDDDMMQHYEDAELEQMALPNPRFYLIEFNDIAFLKGLLPLVADDSRIWVDNDHGDILQGPQFVARVKRDPAWDWRLKRSQAVIDGKSKKQDAGSLHAWKAAEL
jgi:hypothetical protein